MLAGLTGGERAFWPVLAFQAAVSTGTVVCAALLAREWFGRRAGLAAGAICAVYPYYVIRDTSLAETGLFTFLTALGLLLVVRARQTGSLGRAALAGSAMGAAILTRATVAPAVPLIAAWLLLAPADAVPRRRGAIQGLAFVAAVGLVLGPWLGYARSVTGHWTLGTEFGAAVYAGNHPLTFSHYPAGSIDRSRALIFAALSDADRRALARMRGDETAASRWFLERGVAAIAADPGRAASGAVRKLAAAFGPLPSPRKSPVANLVHAATYGPIALLALVGAWRERRRWRAFVPVFALLAVFVAVTAVLWGHTAHRSFLDVYLITLAAPVVVGMRWRTRSCAAGPCRSGEP